MLVPNGGASLLRMLCAEWCIHFRVCVVGNKVVCGIERETVVVKLLLMMVMCLLRHQVMLLVCHMNRLRLIIIPIVEASIRRCKLRMGHELVVLMEGCEFHWRSSRGAASERRMSERQWGRF